MKLELRNENKDGVHTVAKLIAEDDYELIILEIMYNQRIRGTYMINKEEKYLQFWDKDGIETRAEEQERLVKGRAKQAEEEKKNKQDKLNEQLFQGMI